MEWKRYSSREKEKDSSREKEKNMSHEKERYIKKEIKEIVVRPFVNELPLKLV